MARTKENQTARQLIRISGYHQNEDWVRIYIENRFNFQTAKREYRKGYEMKQNGTPCNCRECKQAV